jgi:hypothetical protein
MLVIWVLLFMQSVPLDAVLHIDLHAAILGWLLTAAQPKLQHLRHTAKVRLQLETVIVSIIGRQSFAEVDRLLLEAID